MGKDEARTLGPVPRDLWRDERALASRNLQSSGDQATLTLHLISSSGICNSKQKDYGLQNLFETNFENPGVKDLVSVLYGNRLLLFNAGDHKN